MLLSRTCSAINLLHNTRSLSASAIRARRHPRRVPRPSALPRRPSPSAAPDGHAAPAAARRWNRSRVSGPHNRASRRHDLRAGRVLGNDDREPARHRLEEGLRKSLDERREQEHIALLELRRQVAEWDPANLADPRQPPPGAAGPHDGPHQDEFGTGKRGFSETFECVRESLALSELSGEEDPKGAVLRPRHRPKGLDLHSERNHHELLLLNAGLDEGLPLNLVRTRMRSARSISSSIRRRVLCGSSAS